jgi:hypothetical protein
VIALAVLGAGGLAVALAIGRISTIPWSLVALGAAAALSFENEGDPGRAPLYASALLAIGELAYWSLETRVSRPAVPGPASRRIATFAGLVAGSLAIGAILAAVARVEPGGGIALELVGVAAAVAAAALVLALSRRVAGR